MKHSRALIPVLFAVVVLSASLAFAQHDHSSAQAQASASEPAPNMMRQCQEHHSKAIEALDQAAATLAKTKETSNPEETRTAIDSAQKQLAEAKRHLSTCPMAQAGTMDHSGTDHSQHEQHKMRCMSKGSQSE